MTCQIITHDRWQAAYARRIKSDWESAQAARKAVAPKRMTLDDILSGRGDLPPTAA